MTPDIEVRNLHLRYRDSVAIHDLTFTLDGGKIYGLLGRNGAGKTSLLSVLAGFRLASGGAVRVGGEDPFDNPRVAPQTCFVRETLDFVESVRVRDTLAFARRFRPDRKSTRLNSSHSQISYAVFCLKKKKDPEVIAYVPGGRGLCDRRLAYVCIIRLLPADVGGRSCVLRCVLCSDGALGPYVPTLRHTAEHVACSAARPRLSHRSAERADTTRPPRQLRRRRDTRLCGILAACAPTTRHQPAGLFFFFNNPPPPEISPLPLHGALPIGPGVAPAQLPPRGGRPPLSPYPSPLCPPPPQQSPARPPRCAAPRPPAATPRCPRRSGQLG